MRRVNKLHDFGFYEESPEAYFNSGDRALIKLTSNIAYGGGGSAPSAPTQQTITQNTIPEQLMPTALRLLGRVEALTDVNKVPYQVYGGQRMAGLNPLQQQAYEGTAALGPSSQTSQATGFAGLAGLQAQQLAGSYQPMQERQFYQPMDVSYTGVQAPELKQYQMTEPQQVGIGQLQQYQMAGPERVQAEKFGAGTAREYMSPYMQDVVEQQKQSAIKDYARNIPALQAAGVRAGARGGTREALLQAEARKGLQEQLGGIEATGRQQAFQQAQQQFGADRAAQLQAQQLNQAAGLTAGQANLQALLGTQQLGTQSGLQAALANQQAGLTRGQANLQAALQTQGLGAQQGLQAQQLNQAAQLQAQQQALGQRGQMAQFGLQGAQLGEQSRQFGANLGVQGIQQQLAAAQALGGLGQQEFGQRQAALQAQMGAGSQLQAMEQQRLEQQYQDFLAQQRYPYSQLGFLSDVLRGIPTSQSAQSIYAAQPSMVNQLAGAGMTAYGLGNLFGRGG
jgi:hypothetical protein